MLSDSIIHPISRILTKINPLLINESIRSIYSFQLIQLQLRTIAFNPIKRLRNHLYSPSRRQTQWNIVPTTEISFLADNRAAIAPIKVRALAPFAYSNCCLEAIPSDSDGQVGMRLIWLSASYQIVKIFANERGEASTSRREGALNSKDAAIG